jgi:DNA end-binding protein Ku
MAKSSKSKSTDTDKQAKVANLSGQLNDLLNAGKKQEAADAATDVPQKKSASRSNFKGTLVIPNPNGGVLSSIPVKTFVAVDEDKIERHMYHGDHTVVDSTTNKSEVKHCGGSLKQGTYYCESCGETVPKETALKGVEVDDKIVFVSDSEMKAQQPIRDGKMAILAYIDESEINPIFYESTEFVAPDGTTPVLTAFAMLVEGLKRTGKVAKGVRVKGGREQYFVLRPYGTHGMTMHYLYADYEVRNCDKWTALTVDEKLVQVMAKLIEATAVPFTAASQDTFLANVRRLIKQKAAGVDVTVPEAEVEEAVATDLEAALNAALNFANATSKAKKATAN